MFFPVLIKLFCLISLVKASVTHDPLRERPIFMACLYTFASGFLRLAFSPPLLVWLIWTGVGLALACLYFWLLSRTEEIDWLWWIICLAGIPLVLI